MDAAFVREQSPDVVIVATGGVRPELAAAGTAATPVIGVTDFLASEIGERVAVLGFNAQATDTAHYLIAQGKKVTVIAPEAAEAFGAGQSMMLNAFVKPAFFAASENCSHVSAPASNSVFKKSILSRPFLILRMKKPP